MSVSSQRIVLGNQVGTAVFVVTAVLAAVIFTTPFQWIGAVTALALFAVGVFAFLWSYFHAVNRSRTEEIGVAQLYLLTGPPTPGSIRRAMLALLGVQVATATVTTFARLDGPDGKPGSSLAVGFLVPMLGFGLNGLWCAFHGTFPPRRLRAGAAAHRDDAAPVGGHDRKAAAAVPEAPPTADATGERAPGRAAPDPDDDPVVDVVHPIRKNDAHG